MTGTSIGRIADRAMTLLGWALRLAPGLALSSLLFVLDDGMRWAGLLGLPLLVLAFYTPGCAGGACRTGRESQAWPGI